MGPVSPPGPALWVNPLGCLLQPLPLFSVVGESALPLPTEGVYIPYVSLSTFVLCTKLVTMYSNTNLYASIAFVSRHGCLTCVELFCQTTPLAQGRGEVGATILLLQNLERVLGVHLSARYSSSFHGVSWLAIFWQSSDRAPVDFEFITLLFQYAGES